MSNVSDYILAKFKGYAKFLGDKNLTTQGHGLKWMSVSQFLANLQNGRYLEHNVDLKDTEALVIVDTVIRGYLQALPEGTWQERISWLNEKVVQAKSYLLFLEAREEFVAVLEGKGLEAVISRVTVSATDVEAGQYSLRDVKNVFAKIEEALEA